MEVTLGGDRLGSGTKQKVEMHDYKMSSFNQEQDFKSPMAPGILYPFLKLIGTNHGTFDIDLDQFIRTIPTNGPLFGSFKFQADIFCVPIRLYQGILHNNPIKIGLNMDRVYLPKILLTAYDGYESKKVQGSNQYNYQIADNALLKYLGMSGLGTAFDQGGNRPREKEITRKINAVPVLAYYDIFKNYYANKQEEYAYVITPGDIQESNTGTAQLYIKKSFSQIVNDNNWQPVESSWAPKIEKGYTGNYYIKIEYENIDSPLEQIEVSIINSNNELDDFINNENISSLIDNSYCTLYEKTKKYIILSINDAETANIFENADVDVHKCYIKIETITTNYNATTNATIALTKFKLANIDTMRQKLLSNNFLGQEYVIDSEEDLPYQALCMDWNQYAMNGLVVKTYQSDLYNNWLNSETINEITQRTTMDTSDGFTMDQLNFMEKSYDVLTRIAITDGTYEDWQEAVYGEGAIRKAETPMYMGGMSAEVMFEEVIATTDSNAGDDYQALGTLGGKGTAVNAKGGQNIHIKCEEPCYIIGIASLTPRIAYSQGNDWDLTELNSLDDLHKPGFDGIGFQDLMIEQFAWWNTQLIEQVPGEFREVKHSAGKQTAWINYQTAVDKIYGDFADINKSGYMVLNRMYERGTTSNGDYTYTVPDLTTYIDPAKYNYAFSYKNLDAQNFWVQIHSKVITRRKMAAQQIPNL